MARIGRFTSERARRAHHEAYAALERLWPLASIQVDVATSYGTTHVRRSGDGAGTPVVLLHGFPGNGLTWHGFVEGLASDREVLAPDTIGAAGRSVQTAPLGRDEDFGAWFREVLDGVGVRRAHAVGESQGAWHAALVALHAADRVASLSLIEPNGVLTRTPWRSLVKMIALGANPTAKGLRRMGEWLTPGVALRSEEVACARAALGYRTGLGWARPLTDTELARLGVPTLAIFGAESVLSEPAASAARLSRHVPGAEVEIYPGAGHGVRGQVPREVAARIGGFLRRQDEGSRPRLTGDSE